MATLSSPGVSVTVTDESFYAPAEPGTVPLLVVATAENKLNGSGTGTAPGTLKANAGEVYALTSQKDLVDTFGDPVFKTDAQNNPIHAGEQNEYGLQAGYSLLGVSNSAFVVRADIDLNQLTASVTPPTDDPLPGTYWFNNQTSLYGVFEWNSAPITSKGGQTFTNKAPIVISDPNKVVDFSGSDFTPKTSVGVFGDYAIVTLTTSNEMYFKNRNNVWVLVGSSAWKASWPAAVGSKTVTTVNNGDIFNINGVDITISGTDLASVVTSINTAVANNAPSNLDGISAVAYNNKLELYNDGSNTDFVHITNTTGNLVSLTNASTSDLGFKNQIFNNPRLTISKHTQVPTYKINDATPRPTGSVWIKSTAQNLGAHWKVSRFNGDTKLWQTITSNLYANSQSAIYNLDRAGGGASIPVGALYVNYNFDENVDSSLAPAMADFKIMKRTAVGETVIQSNKIGYQSTNLLLAGTNTFFIAESVVGSEILGDYNQTGTDYLAIQITFTATGTVSDADAMAAAINASTLVNVYAEVDSLNRVLIKHRLGGEFRIKNGALNPFTNAGFATYDPIAKTGSLNLFDAPVGDVNSQFVASLWSPLVYTASEVAPSAKAEDGRLWYSSTIDDVDVMVHDGNKWVGYQTLTSPFYSNDTAAQTDPLGPIVAATAPETQSDGSALVTGDLWIDTSDIENYPMIYKFNAAYENKPIKNRWILVDKTDQSTEEGIIFADARYATSGEGSESPALITDLLGSNFVDFDAPDPDLYPKGMLLWNLRRSGFNVKRFVHNYIETSALNSRFNDEPMELYYTNRWVTESANQEDGSGTFGRKSQRKVVVQAMQATVNANQLIRDEESRVFNVIACPGYPELIDEMISLNFDRGLTAFVLGDTPARLTSDSTSLLEWGSNQNLALQNNDIGAPSHDEYMAMFYPWGFTSDNFGNDVAVPPSHMMLRTIALSDQASHPWFAPAGLRRGGITNASAVGYITSEGEFKSVALTEGQRDTLYNVNINPITFFSGSGLVNFGQKTRAKSASSLDRINVARLVVYLRRRLSILSKPYIFEPNDKITRDELKATIESLMLELTGQRAITDYLVVCDTSNNTPTRIDRNELYADIAIIPTRAVEFIYIPVRLKNTGSLQTTQ